MTCKRHLDYFPQIQHRPGHLVILHGFSGRGIGDGILEFEYVSHQSHSPFPLGLTLKSYACSAAATLASRRSASRRRQRRDAPTSLSVRCSRRTRRRKRRLTTGNTTLRSPTRRSTRSCVSCWPKNAKLAPPSASS